MWAQDGGYELPLTMLAALFAITAGGPGAFSLDRRSWGTPWAIAALASGAAGAYAMLELAKRTPEPEPAAPTGNGQPAAEQQPVGSAN